jgi:hypothetical protein
LKERKKGGKKERERERERGVEEEFFGFFATNVVTYRGIGHFSINLPHDYPFTYTTVLYISIISIYLGHKFINFRKVKKKDV